MSGVSIIPVADNDSRKAEEGMPDGAVPQQRPQEGVMPQLPHQPAQDGEPRPREDALLQGGGAQPQAGNDPGKIKKQVFAIFQSSHPSSSRTLELTPAWWLSVILIADFIPSSFRIISCMKKCQLDKMASVVNRILVNLGLPPAYLAVLALITFFMLFHFQVL